MLTIISHPDCHRYDPGEWYPDVPARLDVIEDRLISSGLEFVVRREDAREATRDQLVRAHAADYVDTVIACAPSEGLVHLDSDTVMTPQSLPAALRSAGAAVRGADLLMRSEAETVFCLVRPPGHHAERDKAMGFCLFNNIAVGVAHALESHNLKRVAILDFDVHHGNGTEDIFRDDERVLFCSTFQHPFYPFTGHESDTKNLVDVPLTAGADGQAFREGVSQHWLPALDEFKPELVAVSAGFDGHVADDMSGLALTDSDFAWVTREIRDLARRHCDGRVLSVLEGGYELPVLGNSVLSHLRVLAE